MSTEPWADPSGCRAGDLCGDGGDRELRETAQLLLEDAGFEGQLINAWYVKNLPGRKTDMSDATWLARLARTDWSEAPLRLRADPGRCGT